MAGNGNVGTQIVLFNPLTEALCTIQTSSSLFGTAKKEVKEVTNPGAMHCRVRTFFNFLTIFALVAASLVPF
jgi:hypothetical protein